MQEAKLKSWKTFHTINDEVNLWNIVYKIASRKIRTSTRLTTPEKEDGTYTTDTRTYTTDTRTYTTDTRTYTTDTRTYTTDTRMYTTDTRTYTTDTRSKIMHMLEHFIPDDRVDSDNKLHRKIRKKIQEPTDMADDKAFRKEEITANLKQFNSKKAPGKYGLTSDILI
jgi:hypothetical protein